VGRWDFVVLNEIRDQLRPLSGLTREEIEKRINELTRKYVETGDKEIIKKLDELSLELEKLEKKS
jgi:hypothetical protein